ncbi:FlgO family outer membrane protein [Pokkaliibacter sp. CJK22405]|uniref:FlgO family outer membrane protein n=1 Tax=Pokkaliibacter sp. CJK22405 TaxID=3384615 RepID=UPI00398539EC
MKAMRTWAGLLSLAATLTLAGCETDSVKPAAPESANLVTTSQDAATKLLSQLAPADRPTQPVMVASYVNIDELSESSTLGRTLAEQMASSLTQQGIPVVELKLRNALFIQEGNGEFLLSRELKDISRSHQAQMVVVGTYAVARQNVYVSTRLVRVADNRIMASDDYRLPMDGDVRSMAGVKRYY